MLDSFTHEQLWQIANIGGLVVAVAVAALLTTLVVLVRTIETRVNTIRETLKQAVANTADAKLIAETAKGVDAVLAEGLEHHLFLGRVLDKVRV
jgi:hypothetical protein